MSSSASHAAAIPVNTGGYVPALDGVRGIAILMVMVFHFYVFDGGMRHINAISPMFESTFSRLALFGERGVDLFFVLSGFLITGILLDSRRSPRFFSTFYARRLLRVFPLYYGALSALILLSVAFHYFHDEGVSQVVRHQVWLWLYLDNIPPGTALPWNNRFFNVQHFWSLAIEEQFYLVWPLVVFCCSRRWLMRLCIGLALAAIGCRAIFALFGVRFWTTNVFTLCRIDSLALGALAAQAIRSPGTTGRAAHHAKTVALVCGALMTFLVFKPHSLPSVQFPMLQAIFERTATAGFFAASIILVAYPRQPLSVGRRLAHGLAHPVLTTLGKYSYGLYVLHGVLNPQIRRRISVDWLVTTTHSRCLGVAVYLLAAMLISFAAAYLSWHLLEKHFLKLKTFFTYDSPVEPNANCPAERVAPAAI